MIIIKISKDTSKSNIHDSKRPVKLQLNGLFYLQKKTRPIKLQLYKVSNIYLYTANVTRMGLLLLFMSINPLAKIVRYYACHNRHY